MTAAFLRRWDWAGLAVTSVSIAILVVIALAASDAPFLDDAIFLAAGIAPALVGAMLTVRRPGNRVGIVLVVIGSSWSLSEASRLYLWMSIQSGPLPAADLPAWFLFWSGPPAWMLIPVLVAIFPSGTISWSPLRLLVRVVLACLLTLVALAMFAEGTLEDAAPYLSGVTNPVGLLDANTGLSAAIETVLLLPFVLLIFGALVDVVRRWRSSHGIERLQMRWFAFGVLVMVVMLCVGTLMYRTGIGDTRLENLATTLAISAPPVAIGVAVARYRLYDIDRVISRAVGYALLTVGLAATYLGLVVGLQALLRPVNEGSDLSIAVTTLVVAALFLPARRWVQALVDRRFNRRAYDAARTMDEFSARLRQEVDLDTLRYELLSVVDETMEPVKATLWLRSTH